MSGTSLDGVDIACCTFTYDQGWQFKIDKAQTIAYAGAWVKKLSTAHTLSAEKLMMLDAEFGRYLGTLCNDFVKQHKIKGAHFISSHGHTVFHQPKNGFTLQIGNGNGIYAVTNLPVICDFRSLDVARGGEGAPLVPAGDKVLFAEYDSCLNLGGIANLSLEHKKNRIAFDICFLNVGLNYLAQQAGKKFDAAGGMASNGEVNTVLLKKLDKVYAKIKAKRPSLGRELFEKEILSLLADKKISVKDRLRTFTESSAKEIVAALRENGKSKTVLCTGGGTLNTFLIYRIIELCGDDITLVIPDADTINFKEALVFAFLGVLRIRNEANCLKSVTGASHDSSSGVMVGF